MIIKTLLQSGVILVCTYLSGFVILAYDLFSVTHLQVGSNIAISASTFLSTRQLCNVIQLRQFCLTRTEVRKSDNYHHHAEKLTTYLRGLRTFNLLLLCASYFPLLWWVCVSEHIEPHKQSSCVLKANLLKITSCRLIATQFWRTKVALSFM